MSVVNVEGGRHQVGKPNGTKVSGRRGRRSPITLEPLLLGLAILIAFVPGIRAHALSDGVLASRDYLLEVQASPADATVLALAYAELGRVDSEALEMAADFSESGTKLVRQYDKLVAETEEVDLESAFWLVQDTPVDVMRRFESGDLHITDVFAAARDVQQVSGTDDQLGDVLLVQTVDTKPRTEALQQRIDKFDASLEKLDSDTAALLEGDFSVEDVSADKLRELVEDGGELAEEAQLQLDFNLAASLPDLSDESNGQLDPDLLCPIPWEPTEQLLCAVMGNFERLNQAYRAEFGTDLPILNGYRTLDEQYYVNAQSPNMTAIPGTSNHGLGQAIDFNWDVFDAWTDPEVVWMIENGPEYGFRLPSALGPATDRPEPWHYEFGTSYSDDNSADFLGPQPTVVYRVISPWNP